ncbi:MAG: quinone-dependent dihydroorotate dehydrogenase [Balneolaceae bacterium]|nr:quinone-dependent dihydroorotate dehydrogenase [Balneolaceae bacterium]MBO6547532.1 quinone-dependent dihydroorotate dehydrogenase [Balneolaceae bacterium]MBO6648044.1 quinone-dependent dihydroorotate dehydrogenase [Balneolaceae bacterium]
MIYKSLAKPLLFKKNAESAHELAVKISNITSSSSLLQALTNTIYGYKNSKLHRDFFGLRFPNPVGLAAGFDKNGESPLAMQALGFGFVEVGSITARPSQGNPKPRAFRLPTDHSLINRMGLNNEGAEAVVRRLSSLNLEIPLGVNIAKTNDASIHGDAAIQDYLTSYELANTVADYITVNISCPNTGEGKTFEDPDALEALLKGLNIGAVNLKPTLVKFSVDTDQKTLETLVEICERYAIAGYIATNTSSSRANLKTPLPTLEQIGNGGLSGRAIAEKSTQVIGWLKGMLKGNKPIIGVGGIDSEESALTKLEAGADLLQIYTGLVYEGPGLVKRIKQKIAFD